ncbi:DMT family transporter [Pseudomonas gingeri]|uniref:EamA family transporter n=2 Tax=Pseudomonas gingeri TaxID=117681 RepID=A0A7Y7YAJ2_9PSED|nr:EamA family transporter [Pseudomonas gingeri]NVZ99048.1 EamA family transporter [Pseudomonas gingeri]NWA13093.1 EamA family transporter [Pseudomonas gingeri]NWA55354.1 EamA family transporter [Pseudomonas gingeri]NWA95792.1 EamA family transporter [Pseudomonas gingeri]NWB00880.1 EamA family transporter [Pseudomonas gingeri]
MHTQAPAFSPSNDLWVYFKLAGVSMIWGGTFVAGRFLSADIAPLLLASLRFLLASVILLVFIAVARIPLVLPDKKQFAQLAVLGFFGIFLYNLCFFYGLHYINASRASLIVVLNPAVFGLASWLFFKERLSPLKVLGILVCMGGAGLVIVSGNRSPFEGASQAWIGDLLIFGCVLSWAVYSLFSRDLTRALGPLTTVTYSIWLGTAMLWLATWLRGEASLEVIGALNPPQLLSLVYLGGLGSALAYIWYYDGIQRIGATRAGVFIGLNPLTAVICGALLLGEQLTSIMCLGGVLILAGIYLCNRPPRLSRKG